MQDDSSPPAERWPRRAAFEILLGAAAAAPTLVGAALGSPLAIDDWGYAARSRYFSFAAGYGRQTRSRPIEGLWNWAEFRVLGTHTVPHLLILAALNVAAAILFWRLLERWVPHRIAVMTAVVWVALPNRGSTHLWSTNSPHVFSLVMLLATLLVASEEPLTRRRFAAALALLVVGTLAYEGGIALGVAGLTLIAWRRRGPAAGLRWGAVTVVVMGAIGLWVLVTSPKLGVSPAPFRNVSHLAAAHFGPDVVASPVIAFVVLVGIAWSVVTVVLPAFRPLLEQKMVVVGLVVVVLGAAPFAAGGFPFSTSGFFDRGNLFSDLGTALVFGSLISLLLRLPWRRTARALAVGAVIAVAITGIRSVRDYVRAGRDGRRLLAAIDALPVDVRTRGPAIFSPLPSHHGVSEFHSDYDISGALGMRYHTGRPLPRVAMAVSIAAFKRAELPKFELVGDVLVQRT